MCEPVSLTIASLALVGAGTAMQMQGAAKAQRAQEAANNAELFRQKGYRDESFGLFDKSLAYNQGDTQQERERKSAQDLNAQFQQAADNVFSGVLPNGTSHPDAPKAIGDIYKKSMDEARGSIQNMLTAKAALGGFNQMLGNTSLQNQNITNSQTPLGGFMRGSAAVLPLELQAASHAGDRSKNIGAMLSALGTVAGMGATATAAGLGSSAGSLAAGTAKGAGTATSLGGVGATIPVGAGTVAGGGSSGLFGFLGGGSALTGAQRAALLAGQ